MLTGQLHHCPGFCVIFERKQRVKCTNRTFSALAPKEGKISDGILFDYRTGQL